MTTGKLDEFSREPFTSNPFRPLKPEAPVVAANHRSRRNSGEFGQRTRQGVGERRVRPKTLNGSGSCRFVTVCVHECSSKSVIDPHIPRLCVEREPFVGSGIKRVRLVMQLIVKAAPDLWDVGAYVHQMPHGSTSRNQRNHQTAVRVPHCYKVAVASNEGRAHHIGISVEAGRAVVDWQVHRDHVMTSLLEKRTQPLPTPRAVPRSMHQSKRRHCNRLDPSNRTRSRKRHPAPPPTRGSQRTMYVWSDGDAYVLRKGACDSSRYVSGDYRFETLHGSHWMLDEQPDAVADLLLEWIAAHPIWRPDQKAGGSNPFGRTAFHRCIHSLVWGGCPRVASMGGMFPAFMVLSASVVSNESPPLRGLRW
jgi:hypothetical protein